MKAPLNDRKLEHLHWLETDDQTDRQKYYFDAVTLRHRALPEQNLEDVDPSVTFLGKRLSFPLLISSMTGGDHQTLRSINRNLAQAAQAEGIAMGVGSQRVMFEQPGARKSFELRAYAPDAVLLGNLGAVQFNYGFTVEHVREAVDVLEADGLFLHLNPLQEAIQPEGNTRFAGLADKIGACVEQCPVPVVIKEVGAGLSVADAKALIAQGVKALDIAGSGGTSWSRIEQQRGTRAHDDRTGFLFQDWGLPTPLALQQLSPLRKQVTLMASGGLRSGLDMARAMALGASLCGMAHPFLEPARESADAVRAVIRQLKREFTTALFLTGLGRASELTGNEEVILSAPGRNAI